MMTAPALASAPARSGEWLEDPGFGIYVHIPFCRRRCHYCDFNTYEGQDGLHRRYVDALLSDIRGRDGIDRSVTSIFFGGGTPTLLPPASLAAILNALRDRFEIAANAEITVEANPETVDEEVFERLLSAGFNRFSIGIQSVAPHVLQRLGREHSPEVARAALHAARRAGVSDLNADLIYGSVWETDADWVRTLTTIAETGTDHLSAYALTIEEGTPLATLVATGRVPDVDPDVQAERFETAQGLLSAAGLHRYEVSNWSKPGRASRHNLLYWSAGDYLGFGAGAHAHLSGRRSWTLRLPRDYIAAVEGGLDPEDSSELLDGDQRAGEALMLGLRLTSGIPADGFARRFGARALADRSAAIAALERDGLLSWTGGRLTVAPAAVFVSNEVASRLL